jgi:hypothetical protein
MSEIEGKLMSICEFRKTLPHKSPIGLGYDFFDTKVPVLYARILKNNGIIYWLIPAERKCVLKSKYDNHIISEVCDGNPTLMIKYIKSDYYKIGFVSGISGQVIWKQKKDNIETYEIQVLYNYEKVLLLDCKTYNKLEREGEIIK